MSTITRQKKGKTFQYYKAGALIKNEDEIERINSLAVPPAWKDVEIASSVKSKVQASGYDAAGRKQAIYSPEYRKKQEQAKYEKILSFAAKLPKLREQLAKDLKQRELTKTKVLACVVKLMDEQYFRVGNKTYAKENEHYGVTTLRSKHIAEMKDHKVIFSFVGKSGQKHVKAITNPQLIRVIKQLDDTPGHELFRYDNGGEYQTIDARDVNEYIQAIIGKEYSAKDFRTWGATLLATSYILDVDEKQSDSKARHKTVTAIIKKVAKKLGNTPAIAKQSYIDPRVITAFEGGTSVKRVKETMANMKPKKYRSVEEQCVLKLLNT